MRYLICCLSIFLIGCDEHAWNDPYPKQPAVANVIYTAFTIQPKQLDPARTFSENEISLIMQIYEPALEYNYLQRPYQLQPLTIQAMPETKYDAQSDTTTYTLKVTPGIYFQPHPALAKDDNGQYYYHSLTYDQSLKYNKLADFAHTGTRELKAADYVYQIKRLADPKINSPVYGLLSPYIIGMDQLRNNLQDAYKQNSVAELDLRGFDFAGAYVVDDYTYQVKIKHKYPQFKYWLAMTFFVPMPWEAIAFYNQPGLSERNISLSWYPIGTAAFYLAENNPEKRMVLQRNPNYRATYYPTVGAPGDAEKGLLDLAGKQMPFVDAVIYSLEKENIPYWDKFLQGYYDASGISSDNFNAVITTNAAHGLAISPALVKRNYRLAVESMPTVWYWGFNMLDNTVGGNSERAKKIRKAISLAFDVDEYITIFANGRAVAANGPIPPGIFGYTETAKANPVENLALAKKLLAEAGYADGRDNKTGQPLQLNFDTMSSGDPSEQALFGWIRKQVAKLGIELNISATDYNRYQEKMNTGNFQMYMWGWGADYPDPEDFLFLFYSPNSKLKYGGENASNYSNPKFDALYDLFKVLDDGPQRLALINEMVAILREDVPWVWGYYPQSFALYSPWYHISKPSGVINNALKYIQINPQQRADLRLEWNKPKLWPFLLVVGLLLLTILPAVLIYRRNQDLPGKRLK